MKRRKTWKDKLTAKERRHLLETSNGTLASFKRNLAWMKANPSRFCFECADIARKLGI